MAMSTGPTSSTITMVQPHRMEISIRCVNLYSRNNKPTKDLNLVCAMYQRLTSQNSKDAGNVKWHEVGRTEQVKNDKNPVWKRKIEIDYRFEERQEVKFEVYDWDTMNDYDWGLMGSIMVGISGIAACVGVFRGVSGVDPPLSSP